jgi:hypothetical protein
VFLTLNAIFTISLDTGKLYTIEERNQKRLQKMVRSPMLMDWLNQYCENGYLTKSNLLVQCNPHQNYNEIHHGD